MRKYEYRREALEHRVLVESPNFRSGQRVMINASVTSKRIIILH